MQTPDVLRADAALRADSIDESRHHAYDRAAQLARIRFLEAGLGIATVAGNAAIKSPAFFIHKRPNFQEINHPSTHLLVMLLLARSSSKM